MTIERNDSEKNSRAIISINTAQDQSSDSGSPSASSHGWERVEWRQWLSENGPRLLLFARSQTRSTQDAEDLLQDALIKLAGKLADKSFTGGQDAWKPYMYTAIRRLAIDLGRKNDRRLKREEKSEADRIVQVGELSDPWFESDSANDETRIMLEDGIKKLPKKFSEVIVMKIWEEMTFAEISKILDISLNTVASRYRYGLEHLRKNLGSSRRENDI